MKKRATIFLAFCSVLTLSPPVASKVPQHKGIFNLATNSRYYKYVEYLPSKRFEQTLRLAIIDKRPTEEKVFNEEVQWIYDDIWTEPLPSMFRRLFFKQLKMSNMFKSVTLLEGESPFTLELELNSFVGHYDRTSRMAKGVVNIRSVLRATTDNRIIMDTNYEEMSSYKVHAHASGWKHMVYHMGKALHTLVDKMMMDLERALHQEVRK